MTNDSISLPIVGTAKKLGRAKENGNNHALHSGTTHSYDRYLDVSYRTNLSVTLIQNYIVQFKRGNKKSQDSSWNLYP